MDINVISAGIKMFFVIWFSILITTKLSGNKYKKLFVVYAFLEALLLAIVYLILKGCTNSVIALCIIYILMCYLIKLLNRYKASFSMLVVLVSMAICLIAFGTAVIMMFPIYKFLQIENNIVNSILIGVVQSLLIFAFFKIKRFNKGFSFLKRENEYINIIIINISATIIYVYFLLGNYYHKTAINMFIMFTFLGIFMAIMIQQAFVMHYKQILLNQTIEDYKKEIKEKDETIQKLSDEKFNISKINHEFYNRQKALELKVKEMMLEAGEEINVLDRINNLTKEYSENLQKIKGKPKLPLTDIAEIDDMFKYMQTECSKYNIDFNLQIEGNIYHLINNIIPKNKLETLIGDHIKDAIIAIDSSDNKNKSILAILGIKENYYEFCVYDTGIEFEINTLLKLGTERITTHKEDGGSGIGFMTTFETLKECKASLIIEERHEVKDNDYTKAVIIRFDGKNEYKIRSYRAEEIRKKVKDKRIIIEKY